MTSPDPNKPRQFHFKTLSFTTKVAKEQPKTKASVPVSLQDTLNCTQEDSDEQPDFSPLRQNGLTFTKYIEMKMEQKPQKKP